MDDTKLSRAKIPTMKPKTKPKKLGLLTSPKRKMVTFRMRPETIESMMDMLKEKRKTLYHGITKTDLIEAALLHLGTLNKDEFAKACKDYGIIK